MNIALAFPVHVIPLWFLLLSLFLPRISIILAWLQQSMPQFIPPSVTPIPVIVALLLPRFLILFWIYFDQGVGAWFILHLVVTLMVWGGSGGYHSRRRLRRTAILHGSQSGRIV